MKKRLILICEVLLVILLLCACGTGGRNKASEPTPTSELTPEPTTPPTSWTVTTESAADILALAEIPSLKTVDATQSREYDAILQLHSLRPDIDLTWNYEFQGTVYPCNTTELKVTDLTGLEDAIRYLPEVNYIDLIETDAAVDLNPGKGFYA